MTGLHANGQTITKPPCPLPEAKPGAGLLDNYLTMMDKKTGVCKKDATRHDSPSPGSLSEYKIMKQTPEQQSAYFQKATEHCNQYII